MNIEFGNIDFQRSIVAAIDDRMSVLGGYYPLRIPQIGDPPALGNPAWRDPELFRWDMGIHWMQEQIENIIPGYMPEGCTLNGIIIGAYGPNFPYYSVESLFASLGLPGWRRCRRLNDDGTPMIEYGHCQYGDLIGAWLFEDIAAVIDKLTTVRGHDINHVSLAQLYRKQWSWDGGSWTTTGWGEQPSSSVSVYSWYTPVAVDIPIGSGSERTKGKVKWQNNTRFTAKRVRFCGAVSYSGNPVDIDNCGIAAFSGLGYEWPDSGAVNVAPEEYAYSSLIGDYDTNPRDGIMPGSNDAYQMSYSPGEAVVTFDFPKRIMLE